MLMAEKFDPYRMWLGIPPAEQPPNHYRLLGVGLFESDADVISNAADRQMVHVRTFQGGKYSALSQRVLNELSGARVCLLDPKKKAGYDDQLRKQMASKVAVLRPVAVTPGGVPVAVPIPTPVAVPTPTPVAVPVPMPAPGPAWPPGPTVDLPPLVSGASPVAMPTPTPAAVPQPPVQPPANDPAVFVPKPVRPAAGAATVQKPSTAWQIPAVVGLLVLLALIGAIYWLSQSGGPDVKSPKTPPEGVKSDAAPHADHLPTAAATPPVAAKKAEEAVLPAKPKAAQLAESGSSGVGGADLRLTVQPEAAAPHPLPVAPEEPKPPPVKAKAPAVPKKPAVPDEEACRKAEEALKAGPLKEDFESADRPSLKAALARTLIDRGNAAGDLPEAYGALKLALDLGDELGETDVAFAAIDGMGRKFDLDPVATKVDVLEAMLKARVTAVAANRGLWAEKVLTLAHEALAAEKPDSAQRLVLIARPMSKAGRDSAVLAKRVQTLAKQVAEAQKLQAELRQARQRLETQPDDPEANERLGTYFCFLKGNWEEGLPRLAKSAEPGLKRLAQTELSNPVFVDQQYALANDWWTLAGTQSGKARRQVLLHARHWYEVAEPNLSGAEKDQAHKRMIENDQAEPAGDAEPAPPAKARTKQE
jgi:hypothetical protein